MDEIKLLNESSLEGDQNGGIRPPKRFKFVNKSKKLKHLTELSTVNVLSRFQLEKLQSDNDDVCIFVDTLRDLYVKDISPEFKSLSLQLRPLAVNLPAVVHHLEKVVDLLCEFLNLPFVSAQAYRKAMKTFSVNNVINLSSPLMLVNVLSREIGELLFPHLSKIFKALVGLIKLNEGDVVSVDSVFGCLNGIFVDQSEYLSRQSSSFLIESFSELIFSEKHHIRLKIFELLSNTLRQYSLEEVSSAMKSFSKKSSYRESVSHLFKTLMVDFGGVLFDDSISQLKQTLTLKFTIVDMDVEIVYLVFLGLREDCKRKIFSDFFSFRAFYEGKLEKLIKKFDEDAPEILNTKFVLSYLRYFKTRQLNLIVWNVLFTSMLLKANVEQCRNLENFFLAHDYISDVDAVDLFECFLKQIDSVGCLKFTEQFKTKLVASFVEAETNPDLVLKFISIFELKFKLAKKPKVPTSLGYNSSCALIYFALNGYEEELNFYLEQNSNLESFAFVLQIINKYDSKLQLSKVNLVALLQYFSRNCSIPTLAKQVVVYLENRNVSISRNIFETCLNVLPTQSLSLRQSFLRMFQKSNLVNAKIVQELLTLEKIELEFSQEREKQRVANLILSLVKQFSLIETKEKFSNSFLFTVKIFLSQFFQPFQPLWELSRQTLGSLFKLDVDDTLLKTLTQEIFKFLSRLHNCEFEKALKVQNISLPFQYNFEDIKERYNTSSDAFTKFMPIFKDFNFSFQRDRLKEFFLDFLCSQYFVQKVCTCTHLNRILSRLLQRDKVTIENSIRYSKVKIWLELFSSLKVSKNLKPEARTEMQIVFLYFIENSYNFDIQQMALKCYLNYCQNPFLTRKVEILLEGMVTKTSGKFNESATNYRSFVIPKGLSIKEYSVQYSLLLEYLLKGNITHENLFLEKFLVGCTESEINFLVLSIFVGRLRLVSKQSLDKVVSYFDIFDDSYFAIFLIKQAESFTLLQGKLDPNKYSRSLQLLTILCTKFRQKYKSFSITLIDFLLKPVKSLADFHSRFDFKATDDQLKLMRGVSNQIYKLLYVVLLSEENPSKLLQGEFLEELRKLVWKSSRELKNLLHTYKKNKIKKVPPSMKLIYSLCESNQVFDTIFVNKQEKEEMLLVMISILEVADAPIICLNSTLAAISTVIKLKYIELFCDREDIFQRLFSLFASKFKFRKISYLLEFIILNVNEIESSDLKSQVVVFLLKNIDKSVLDARSISSFSVRNENQAEESLFKCLQYVLQTWKISRDVQLIAFNRLSKYLNKFLRNARSSRQSGIDRFVARIELTELDHWIKNHSQDIISIVYKEISQGTQKYSEITGILAELNAFSKKRINEIDVDRRLEAYNQLKLFCNSLTTKAAWQEAHNDIQLLLNGCLSDIFSEEYSLRTVCFSTILFIQERLLAHKMNEVVIQCILPTIKFGMKCPTEGVRKVCIKLLQSMLLYGNEQLLAQLPCTELKTEFNPNNPDEDIFENLLHIQLHRRSRVLQKMSKNAASFSKITVYEFLFPYIFNIICFRVKKNEVKLVDSASSLFKALCDELKNEEYLEMVSFLCGFLTSEKKEAKQEKMYKFSLSELSKVLRKNDFGQSVGVLLQSVNKRCISLLCLTIEPFLVLLNESDDQAVELCQTILSLLEKSMLKVGNDKVGSRYKLPMIEIYVKLLVHMDDQNNSVHLNRLIKRISQSLRHREFHIRDNARKALVTVFETFYSENQREENILKPILQDLRSLFTEGYQKHVLAYSVSYLLEQLAPIFLKQRQEWQDSEEKAATGCHLDECLFKYVVIFLDEAIGSLSKEKEEGYRSKLKSFHELNKSKAVQGFGLLGKLVAFTPCKSVDRVLDKLFEELEKSNSMKSINKLRECTLSFVRGVCSNKSVLSNEQDFFLFVKAMIDPLQFEQQKKKVRKRKELTNWTARDFQHQVLNQERRSSYGYNLHIVEAVPQLTGFNRYSNVMNRAKMAKTFLVTLRNEIVLSFIETFEEKRSETENNDFIIFVLEILPVLQDANCIRKSLNIASKTENLSDGMKKKLFKSCLQHMKSFGLRLTKKNHAVQSSILKCLKLCLVKKFITEAEEDILLSIIQTNLSSDKQNLIILQLLSRLLKLQVNDPTVFEIMKDISSLLFSSDSANVRKQMRSLLLTFLTTYEINMKNREVLVDKLLANLSHSQVSGRISGLEMLLSMMKQQEMFTEIAKEKGILVFMTIALRLSNEKNNKALVKVEKCLGSLLSFLSVEALQEILDFLLNWWSISTLDQKMTNDQLKLRQLTMKVLCVLAKQETLKSRHSVFKILSLKEIVVSSSNKLSCLLNLVVETLKLYYKDDEYNKLSGLCIRTLSLFIENDFAVLKIFTSRFENTLQFVQELYYKEDTYLAKEFAHFIGCCLQKQQLCFLEAEEVAKLSSHLFSVDKVDEMLLQDLSLSIVWAFRKSPKQVILLVQKQFNYLVKRRETEERDVLKSKRFQTLFQVMNVFVKELDVVLLTDKEVLKVLFEPFVYLRERKFEITPLVEESFEHLENEVDGKLVVEIYSEILKQRKEKRVKRKLLNNQLKVANPRKYFKLKK